SGLKGEFCRLVKGFIVDVEFALRHLTITIFRPIVRVLKVGNSYLQINFDETLRLLVFVNFCLLLRRHQLNKRRWVFGQRRFVLRLRLRRERAQDDAEQKNRKSFNRFHYSTAEQISSISL